LFTGLVAAETAAAMEAHSRAWLVECPHCAHVRSIWDLGGVRYKAAGKPRNYLRCPACGKGGWHRVYKAADFPVTAASPWPLFRLILILGAAAMLVTVLVAAFLLSLGGRP
jgi:ribosomal protein S27E